MSEKTQFKIRATINSPVECMKLVKPKVLAQLMKCETYINAGFFFDGTNNNAKKDAAKLGHSNVSRLYETYKDDYRRGYFRTYVPGVGTSFPEISEFGESLFGGGFGIGCEARVIYAMLSFFNCFNRLAFNEELYFSSEQVRVLCSVGNRSRAKHADAVILIKLGLDSGLLMPDFFGTGQRDEFFLNHSRILSSKLSEKPECKIKECFIDVFGFSRGAAEARVFCSWLNRLLVDGKFAGIPIRFRFVGLMDTVASSGFWSSVDAGITNTPGGHSGWAGVEYLRLPSNLENCIHMVAMHELRKNFPLDEAGVDGVLPPNTYEIAYPGSHSDVGGGYEPGELGISVGANSKDSDRLKLSQIPLNHMLECAIAAGTPLQKVPIATAEQFDPFAVAPAVLTAYKNFLAESGTNARPLREWLQPYLNWRWQNRLTYANLLQVKLASSTDRGKLVKFNEILIKDADLIDRMSGQGKAQRALNAAFSIYSRADEIAMAALDDEAKHVLSEAKRAQKVAPAIDSFFDHFVHDSLAGFNSAMLESTGYWRYRKGFVGGELGRIVQQDAPPDETKTA
jgi:hypothetical protein